MEALIRKRIAVADPYPWKKKRERVDSAVPSVASASSSSTTTSTAAACVSITDDTTSTVDSGKAVRADALLRYVLSHAATTAVSRSTSTPEQTKRGSGTSSIDTSTRPAQPPRESSPKLFESILDLFTRPQIEISAVDIVRRVVSNVNDADVPSEMDATQLVLAVLVFLSLTIPGLGRHDGLDTASTTASATATDDNGNKADDSGQALVKETFPCLPLLERTDSVTTSLSKRKYRLHSALSSGWSSKDDTVRRRVRNLETAFLLSTLAYPARYRLCPRICSAVEEKEVLRKGFVASPNPEAGASPGGKVKSSKEESDPKSVPSSPVSPAAAAAAVIASATARSITTNTVTENKKGKKRKAKDVVESERQTGTAAPAQQQQMPPPAKMAKTDV